MTIIPNEPSNQFYKSLMLTDLYQITMMYAYWKQNIHLKLAVFEVLFRKNPFEGEYTVFCGIDEVKKFLHYFEFTPSDVHYLKNDVPSLSHIEDDFFKYLMSLNDQKDKITVTACSEGTLVFPRLPLLTVSGPLGLVQLLETPILNMINYPSLIATNASRMVLATKATFENDKIKINSNPILLEFGLRRAQGADGGMSASKYSVLGGFDSTSNVLAGKLFNIPISGTHAHSFVMSFDSLDQVSHLVLHKANASENEAKLFILPKIICWRTKLNYYDTNDGELAAFISYAVAFPHSFLALVDTYDTLQSGIKNFILVSFALIELGYKPVGIRLDSGNLSILSNSCRQHFLNISKTFHQPLFEKVIIVASNDLDEEKLYQLKKKTHSINAFGIGTHLVTCARQPALGCVYKLVSIQQNNTTEQTSSNTIMRPSMKLSQDIEKVTIPFQKTIYRIYGKQEYPLLDCLCRADDKDDIPIVNQKFSCRHPFKQNIRISVTPARVECLNSLVFEGGSSSSFSPIETTKKHLFLQLQTFPSKTFLFENPKQYLVLLSCSLYRELHKLWNSTAPATELE